MTAPETFARIDRCLMEDTRPSQALERFLPPHFRQNLIPCNARKPPPMTTTKWG